MKRPPKFLARLARTRRKTLSLVDGLDQRQLDFAPAKGKWSAGEVLDHLSRVDEMFEGELDELLARWRRKPGPVSLARTLSQTGLSLPLVPDAMLPFFDVPAAMTAIFVPAPVRRAILGSRAIPARAPRRIAPRKGRPVDEVRRELADFPERLVAKSAAHEGVEWRRLRYYHPLFGFTNVPGIVASLVAHERRHQEQLRGILASRRFPREA